MNKRKYEAVCGAYISHPTKDIYILNTEFLSAAEQGALLNIQQELGVGFDLSFEILSDASYVINNIELDQLEDSDFGELCNDSGSVYTDARLAYLSFRNQDEVTDIVKEYSCDIQTACAVWYDQKVAEACEALRDYIKD